MAEQSFEESEETEDGSAKPPDGGYGWIVCAASFMAHFIADGLAFSFGVLYVELLDYFGETKGKTAWIGSLFVGVPLLAGPIAGALTNKFGCRIVTMAGSVLATSGFIASFFADSVELLCFFFGIVSGIGLACVYVPAIVIVAFYFDNKRALATGIAVSGSGIGTFVFAPLTEYLLTLYGWRGTLLILGGIVLNISIFGALYRPLETPLDEKKRKYLQSLEKFSKLVTKPAVQNGNGIAHENQQSLAITKNPISLSMQDFSTACQSPQAPKDLRREVLSAANGHASSLNGLDKDLERRGSYNSIRPVNNKELKPVVESKLALSPIERKDIFYRGSVIRLNIPKPLVKSCPALNTQQPAPDTVDKSKCGCLRKLTPDAFKHMLDYTLFKNVLFDLFFISSFLLYMWYDIPYTYLTDHAQTLGIPVSDASFLISILGIASTIGQLIYGYLGDLKQVNTVLLYSFSTAFVGFALILLPFADLYAVLCVFCTVFGFCLSANYTLETIVLVELLGLDQLTNAYGLVMCGQGVANLIGPPIAGWLCDLTGSYNVSFYVAGVGILLSGLMVFLMHIVLYRRKAQEKAKGNGVVVTVTDVQITDDNLDKDEAEQAVFL